VDVVFVVTSANRDFNPRRIERYLAAVRLSGAEAAIVLNKADLCESTDSFQQQLGHAARALPWLVTSADRGSGVEALRALVGAGRTGVLVGSSGVGKSTLMNALLGEPLERVSDLRGIGDKGRHTSTQRVLRPLPGGGVLLDTPGMREFALYDQGDGGAESELADPFDQVAQLAKRCRFRDCAHDGEPGCAVRAELDDDEWRNYEKLGRELEWQRVRQDDASRNDTKRRWKSMTKGMRARRRHEEGD
jgi:ribosome biogenesis GTPase